MPKDRKSSAELVRKSSMLSDDVSASIPQETCIVQTNLSVSRIDESSVGLTAVEYRTLQGAYDYFAVVLFDGSLPQVLITLQRHHRALGYFSAKRFQSRGQVCQLIHEVALNPDGFTGNTDEQILSTLVHEMAHVWQEENGHPGRGRYHNREWALKMCSIGLMPSSTGRPRGAVTGDSMSHYILADGKFAAACKSFLSQYRLIWESAAVGANDFSGYGSPNGDEAREKNAPGGADLNGPSVVTRQTRTKFTCPNCGLNVWAKPDARIDCHECSIEAREPISLLANYERRADKRPSLFGERVRGSGGHTYGN
jgi:hypothetical protein